MSFLKHLIPSSVSSSSSACSSLLIHPQSAKNLSSTLPALLVDTSVLYSPQPPSRWSQLLRQQRQPAHDLPEHVYPPWALKAIKEDVTKMTNTMDSNSDAVVGSAESGASTLSSTRGFVRSEQEPVKWADLKIVLRESF